MRRHGGALAGLVAASKPPPAPFAIFAGRAAWDTLLNGAHDDAFTERDAAAAARLGARDAAAQKRAPPRPPPPPPPPPPPLPPPPPPTTTPKSRSAKKLEAIGSPTTTLPLGYEASVVVGAEVSEPRLLLLCRVLVAAPAGGDGRSASSKLGLLPSKLGLPGTATAEPTHLLPLHLVHYGVTPTTTPPPTTTPHAQGAMAAAAPLPNTAPLPKAAERSALVAQQQQQEPTTAPIASPSRKSGGAQHGAKSGAGRKVNQPTEGEGRLACTCSRWRSLPSPHR